MEINGASVICYNGAMVYSDGKQIAKYVVIELKACDFEPGFISQLNMYQNIVHDILCRSDDRSSIGLLLVKGKNKTVVEYSLSNCQNPIDVEE